MTILPWARAAEKVPDLFRTASGVRRSPNGQLSGLFPDGSLLGLEDFAYVSVRPTVTVDIVTKASYIFSVQTSFNSATASTLIRTFIDSNNLHQFIKASTFKKGKFGFKTFAQTKLQVDEIEMMMMPVDVKRVAPGFDL